MNTNSKHYEELNIQPWEIMERNFSTEEFVAYLKGNIIKYTLRDKGQALTDAEKIKHYAEKLIEVIEKKETDEFLEEDTERIYGKAEPVDEHKFKVGDRVRVLISDKTETIIRTPVEEPKKTLTPNKWYDAEDFTEEELKELLPVGTKIRVTIAHDNDRIPCLHRESLISTCVKNIGERLKNETRVGITADCWWRRYFKIEEE